MYLDKTLMRALSYLKAIIYAFCKGSIINPTNRASKATTYITKVLNFLSSTAIANFTCLVVNKPLVAI